MSNRFKNPLFGPGMGYGIDIARYLTTKEGKPLSLVSKDLQKSIKQTQSHYKDIYYAYSCTPPCKVQIDTFIEVDSRIENDEAAIQLLIINLEERGLNSILCNFRSLGKTFIVSKNELHNDTLTFIGEKTKVPLGQRHIYIYNELTINKVGNIPTISFENDLKFEEYLKNKNPSDFIAKLPYRNLIVLKENLSERKFYKFFINNYFFIGSKFKKSKSKKSKSKTKSKSKKI